MPESPPRLTILQLTHQGEGAGSTQSIFSLSRALAERGHRILVGCPPGTLLARHVAASPTLEHVPLDFSRLRTVAATIAGIIADKRVDVVNSHATGDRRACTWLRWRGRLPGAFVVTRRTMPLTLPPALIAVGLTGDRLRVVPNGIDLDRVEAPPSAPELALAQEAVGNSGLPVVAVVARRKDQQILLRALPALKR